MKHISTKGRTAMFEPLIESTDVQAASMVLKPGESSSELVENEHPHSEQWLVVLSGFGSATVGSKEQKLSAGSVLLIERREPHRITNTGNEPLVTVNFYCPPAYTRSGNVRAVAKG